MHSAITAVLDGKPVRKLPELFNNPFSTLYGPISKGQAEGTQLSRMLFSQQNKSKPPPIMPSCLWLQSIRLRGILFKFAETNGIRLPKLKSTGQY